MICSTDLIKFDIGLFLLIWKIEEAVESLSREVLTIQAKGDKKAASLLLERYSTMTRPLKVALQKLDSVQVGH